MWVPRGLEVFWEQPWAGAVGGEGQKKPATPGGGGDGVWRAAVAAAGTFGHTSDTCARSHPEFES